MRILDQESFRRNQPKEIQDDKEGYSPQDRGGDRF